MDPLGHAVPARPPLPAGPALVVGLGRSGIAATLALRARGVAVVACDGGGVAETVSAALRAAGAEVLSGSDGLAALAVARWVVKSPGVPSQVPVVAAARAAGVPVLGELELGWRLLANPFVAVTGSNGKTTTVEWLGHLHRVAGLPVEVAGNVGTAITSLPGSIDPAAVVVCEASSFQLEDAVAFAPDAATLLNVTEDHLDRHGTLAAYREIKASIFDRQPAEAVAVVSREYLDAARRGAARIVAYGPEPDAALAERDGALWWEGARLIDLDALALRGRHNAANASAAAALALARGVSTEAVSEGLATFGGVAHRLQLVATLDGVAYVDDSKATNVASAVVGLRSFAGGVHLILGGRGKGADYAPLREPVARRCRAVHLIGEAGPAIGAALEGSGVTAHVSGDLARAVATARAAARPGEVVLLAPACASFDQYTSFEARGQHFRELVTRGGR